MKTCPRCHRANAVARESDRWGEYDSCWTCGWSAEVMDGPPLAWSPVNPTRDYLDPRETARKIAAAKTRWRDPDKARTYNRTYKARRAAARQATSTE